MRLVVCDQHRVFAESMAYLLERRGDVVVAVCYTLAAAILVLQRQQADICLTGVLFGNEEELAGLMALCRAAPRTAIVVLTAQSDKNLRAAAIAAGAKAVAEKSRPVGSVVNLLDRVHAGKSVTGYEHGDTARPVHAHRANEGQRLAAFLTPRERQVLSALVRGDDTSTLARSMGISTTTVRGHIQNVLIKMGAHSRIEVVTTAVRAGIVSQTGEWLASTAR